MNGGRRRRIIKRGSVRLSSIKSKSKINPLSGLHERRTEQAAVEDEGEGDAKRHARSSNRRIANLVGR